jgi:SNF2 family DNA or RNA helicase
VNRDFADFRRRLARFDGIRELAAPAGFSGTLRGYQREGLGWLNFLKDFKLGGCLADDMGLGKTVQILALLEQQRDPGAAHAPSLVVLPRTLVTNWLREAERFAPALRVLDFSGAERAPLRERFAQADLVLTTYGVLRRDIAWLRSVPFRWVILDEAQAVKNGNAQTAKAARLLQAEHRLAATGTPVENHLGELGALFDFLNPGLLGRSAVASLARLGAREAPEEPLRLLARALRPFILRRTKAQVLPELPEKTEQVLFCDLGTEQRSLYDELRIHYRAAVDGRIRDVGVGRSKILVLEALLRLRQAACHPGLVDKARAGEAGGKLEVLLHRLEELQAEGNKALVFSQFTSLLAILRPELERRGLTYEYLDGRTRDRQARVDRFQNDPECKLFLISLKAGGQGLNLTAAQYVFLLDPWWNPAVEAQAVDRAHRIGQANKVFAYRLVARDTVEEKILELQSSKRRLADAVISAEAGGLKSLNADDVRLLFA